MCDPAYPCAVVWKVVRHATGCCTRVESCHLTVTTVSCFTFWITVRSTRTIFTEIESERYCKSTGACLVRHSRPAILFGCYVVDTVHKALGLLVPHIGLLPICMTVYHLYRETSDYASVSAGVLLRCIILYNSTSIIPGTYLFVTVF